MQTWPSRTKFFDTLRNIIGVIDKMSSVMMCFNSPMLSGLFKTTLLKKSDSLRSGNFGGKKTTKIKRSSKNQTIYSNHLCRNGLRITNYVYANLGLNIKFSHLESKEKNRYPHIKYRHINK